MLFSPSAPFLFIHIQKTGGESLTRILQKLDPQAVLFLNKHDRAVDAQSHFSMEEWQNLLKFSFVRNPWARLVSWYTMIQDKAAMKPWHELTLLWQYALTQSSNFEEFIEKCHDTIIDRDGVKSFWFNQVDFLCDREGKMVANFVGRQEQFAQDVQLLLTQLNLPPCPLILHENQTTHRHYSHYYSDRTRDRVAEGYSKDIEYFGYTFEDQRHLPE